MPSACLFHEQAQDTMPYQSVKGTKDILPGESREWIQLEAAIRSVMDCYQYEEIRTPIFEETAIFSRGIGEETDIVGKEMYTFTDKGGTSLTLRPEATASAVRAFIQHNLGAQSALNKLYYIGPMFRQERPQAGRLRQFHQFGFESIGQMSPACDAEIIAMAHDIYRHLGITSTLKLNSVGDPTCRPRYRDALQSYLNGVAGRLSPESLRRKDINPLRVLDSKLEQDREATAAAPSILEYLSEESATHFTQVRDLLTAMDIPFTVDPRLVRGLDYYTKTAFEFISTDLGAQDALGGGGRYDGLVEQLGGKPTPAVGFAAGMERLLIVLKSRQYAFTSVAPDVYLVGMDDASRRWSFLTCIALRRQGFRAECDFAARSMKAQMREANRLGARAVVIVGSDEMASERAVVKDMSSGEQAQIAFADLASYLGRARAGASASQE
jgi:histidyl-tRNA synthetase